MTFHFIASTGRTATTYIAAILNRTEDVLSTHEGYLGADKSVAPLIPLINLENRHAYFDNAESVVFAKRNPTLLKQVLTTNKADILVDVAYYNATICDALLRSSPSSRMVGIIRNCEDFVRSATTLYGEDLLPVGWPDPDKPLNRREKFIQMGRIKPKPKTTDAAAWHSWSAVTRNIWLWRETNELILSAAKSHGDRVLILDFSLLKRNPTLFFKKICKHLTLGRVKDSHLESEFVSNENKKQQGYQVGPIETWTDFEQKFAEEAIQQIEYPV